MTKRLVMERWLEDDIIEIEDKEKVYKFRKMRISDLELASKLEEKSIIESVWDFQNILIELSETDNEEYVRSLSVSDIVKVFQFVFTQTLS